MLLSQGSSGAVQGQRGGEWGRVSKLMSSELFNELCACPCDSFTTRCSSETDGGTDRIGRDSQSWILNHHEMSFVLSHYAEENVVLFLLVWWYFLLMFELNIDWEGCSIWEVSCRVFCFGLIFLFSFWGLGLIR